MDTFIKMFWFSILVDLVRTFIYDLIAIYARVRYWNRKKFDFNQWPGGRPPLVSVLVPSLNEEETLEMTVNSLMNQTYGNLQVILIDDGSTDSTPRVQAALAAKHSRVVSISQRRGGKSAALNMGLNLAKGELIMQVDSDTYTHPDGVELLVESLASHPNAHGVGGQVVVYKYERTLVTRLQAMEFIMSFGVGRIASSALGTTKVVSGSFGMYKRWVLDDVGTWDHPMGEDGDMTLKIRKKQGRLLYCPDAICENRVKDNWKGLTKQRYRWSRNYIKNRFRKHLDIGNPFVYGWRNLVMFWDSMIYRFTLTAMIIIGFFGVLYANPTAMPGHMLLVALFYTVVTLVQYPLDCWLVSKNIDRDLWLLLYIPIFHLYRIYMRFLQGLAFLMEGLFWQSYSSPYLPDDVSKAAIKW
ncbi:MAG: glycosyltransferase family 2 protein [Proteobacteria bacterium]|nr:glycosyltransferase family 2 protein [Pseudomonadota bacterium]